MTKTDMESVKINAVCAIVITLSLIFIAYLGVSGCIEAQAADVMQEVLLH